MTSPVPNGVCSVFKKKLSCDTATYEIGTGISMNFNIDDTGLCKMLHNERTSIKIWKPKFLVTARVLVDENKRNIL